MFLVVLIECVLRIMSVQSVFTGITWALDRNEVLASRPGHFIPGETGLYSMHW
jgi:hypothetical protein